MTNEITVEQAQAAMDAAVAAKSALEAIQAKERAKLKADHKVQMAACNKAITKAGRLVAAAAKSASVVQAEAKAAEGQVNHDTD